MKNSRKSICCVLTICTLVLVSGNIYAYLRSSSGMTSYGYKILTNPSTGARLQGVARKPIYFQCHAWFDWQVKSAVHYANLEWNNLGVGALAYRSSTEHRISDIESRKDGINMVSDWFAGTSSYLAYTTWWVSNNKLTEADIVFNRNYPWGYYGEPGRFDVQQVVTHEIGHALGLDDVYSAAHGHDTMYGYTNAGETYKRILHICDQKGILYLYQGFVGSWYW